MQGLQRENVWRFGKGLKGRKKEDDREVNFLNKTQRAIHIYGVPLPETNTIYRSASYYIIKFLGNVIDDARALSYHQFTPRGMV